jgi:hypothetical protein
MGPVKKALPPIMTAVPMVATMRSQRLHGPLVLAAWVSGLVLGACAGCYDANTLISQARSEALDSKLAEIDFGLFHTTLPRDPKSGALPRLEIHFFGTAPHYRVAAIKKQLKLDDFRLRHEVLAAIRACSREELAEPGLTKLRTRIEKIVNGILNEAPVEAIGFYGITIRQL